MISLWTFIAVSIGCAAFGIVAGRVLANRGLREKAHFVGAQRDEFARRLNRIMEHPAGGRETPGIRRLKAIARGEVS